jgi:hypothetical protein
MLGKRPGSACFALWAGMFLSAVLALPGLGICAGDTLTVIQRPLVNIPAIVRPGDTLTVECDADPAVSGWAVELFRDGTGIPAQVLSSTYDPSTLWWEIESLVPAVPLYELYDLVVTASGGIEDTTWNAVQVIAQFRDDYYFIHVTDPHMPTHLFYYESGADTDSSEVVDMREVIKDINIINPEFVLLTGDYINEGELEDFLSKKYFTRCQQILNEFEVPVFLTSGNHDIGGWDDTPPPDGTARRNWWKFFGWKRLDDPPPGAPWYTQNYSFDYGPVHYIGLEAYINYDGWRQGIYGDDSFTPGQMQWLEDEIASASGSAACVLFYHYDFSGQINLRSLGADMALSGHIHRDDDDFSHPYDIITNNVCDGERSYRLIRVSNGTLEPRATVSAGEDGGNLEVEFSPANDGSHYSVTADITNNIDERFEHSRLRFVMPGGGGSVSVTGGTLTQVDDSGPFAVCYVAVDIPPLSSPAVTVMLETDSTSPEVTLLSPGGGEVWDIGSTHDITWTATDNIGVTTIDILLSTDGGSSYPTTIATGESNDGTYSWTVPSSPTTEARIKVIAYDAATNSGEDVSDADFEIHDPAAGLPAGADIPPVLVVSGNTPNPFQDRTSISFGIPSAGRVAIDMYDVSGRVAARIADRLYPAGYHTVVWTNDGTVKPGLYFLRLRCGAEEVTCKVVISG